MPSRALPLAVASIALLAVVAAQAQPTNEERALASALFEQGRQLMAEGKASEACPKLQESHRLDPGGGTLLNLALCHELEGKLATAWAELVEARGLARADGRQDRVDLAQQHIDGLLPKLSYVVVVVPETVRVPGLEILRDGRVIAEGAWGTRMPLDPGSHRIEARAPGHRGWAADVEVSVEPATREIVVAPLEALPPPPVPEPPPSRPADPAPALMPPVEAGLTPLSTAGIVVGSFGVGALIAGAVSGGVAAVKRSESEDEAPSCDPGCSDVAVALNDEAKVAADVSTGTFIAGGVLGVAGLTMLLVGLKPPAVRAGRATLTMDVLEGGASLTARF